MAIDERDRQSDYIVITALNGPDELRSTALDCIGPGFVSWLPASSVLLNLVVCQVNKGDTGTGDVVNLAVPGEQADSGMDPMVAAGEEAKHACGVRIRGGFSQRFFVETHQGVGGEDDIGGGGRGGACFGFSDSADEGGGRFAWFAVFRDMSGPNDVGNAGGQEKLMPTGRSGS